MAEGWDTARERRKAGIGSRWNQGGGQEEITGGKMSDQNGSSVRKTEKKTDFIPVDPPKRTSAGTVISCENTQRKVERIRESTVGSRGVILKHVCGKGYEMGTG